MSDITKKYYKLSKITGIASFLVTAAPVITYIIIGLCQGEMHQRLTLGVTIIAALLLMFVNVIFKYHIRSTIWILTLGIYFCLKDIMPLLLCIAGGTILDEFLITPLHKSYKNKAKINKEIDKRL